MRSVLSDFREWEGGESQPLNSEREESFFFKFAILVCCICYLLNEFVRSTLKLPR